MSNFAIAPVSNSNSLVTIPEHTLIENQKNTPNVAWEILDFLFAAKTIAKIAKGEGTWADAANVGITAATFFLPPAKLAVLTDKVLLKVAEKATNAASSEFLSLAARKAADRTAWQANKLLEARSSNTVLTGDDAIDRLTHAARARADGANEETINWILKHENLGPREWPAGSVNVADASGHIPTNKELGISLEPNTSAAPKDMVVEPTARDWETGNTLEEKIPFNKTEAGRYYKEEDSVKKQELYSLLDKQAKIIETKGTAAVPETLKNDIARVKESLKRPLTPEELDAEFAKRIGPQHEPQKWEEALKDLPQFDEKGLVKKPVGSEAEVLITDPVTAEKIWVPLWKNSTTGTLDSRLLDSIARVNKTTGEEYRVTVEIPRFARFKDAAANRVAILQNELNTLNRRLASKGLEAADREEVKSLRKTIFDAMKEDLDTLPEKQGKLAMLIGDEIKLRSDADKAIAVTGRINAKSMTMETAKFTLKELEKHFTELKTFAKENPGMLNPKHLNDFRQVGARLAKNIKSLEKDEIKSSTGTVVRTKTNTPGAIYIGRKAGEAGIFGNPYVVSKNMSVKEAVANYRKDLLEIVTNKSISDGNKVVQLLKSAGINRAEFIKRLKELKGKTLACPGSESDAECHGQILLNAIKYLTKED
jgi:hypothetical protein